MTKDQIKHLVDRIASGTASDEEIALYNQVYNSFQLGEEEEWKEELYGKKEELRNVMQQAIHDRTGIKHRVVRMRWMRWVAAVFIFGLLGTAAYTIFSNNRSAVATTQKTQDERFKNDVAPGQEGAILMLSDGKIIVVESAHNGSLARESGTDIIKKDGQLIYATQTYPAEEVYNTMTTPRGRQYALILADGSKVWLNAASSITFPTAFTGKERRVSITGEAYFEVAHNAQKPFIVQKGEMSIQVLGTHFNVNSYEDETSMNVTLLEGAVKVRKGNAIGFLKPGQQAQLKNEEIKVVNDADINRVMAWKNGLFDFRETDIGVLMRQLSRWYDVEVVYEKKINDSFFAEIPRNTNLSDVLKALELTGKVKFEIEGKKIVVLP